MASRGTDIKINDQVKAAGGFSNYCNRKTRFQKVDRQLRVVRVVRRSGNFTFYVSLEDNLMRMFQSDRIAGVMDRMGHKDGEVIQHSMITKSI